MLVGTQESKDEWFRVAMRCVMVEWYWRFMWIRDSWSNQPTERDVSSKEAMYGHDESSDEEVLRREATLDRTQAKHRAPRGYRRRHKR